MSKKSVLVIGGGAAGHQIAYQLRDLADVTLVDPKTYWEVPMAVPRLLVEPDSLAARMRYDRFLGAANHVQGKVIAIADSKARVAIGDGTERMIAYDYAVIATGSTTIDPLIKAQAKTEDERSAPSGTGRGVALGFRRQLRLSRIGIALAAQLKRILPGVANEDKAAPSLRCSRHVVDHCSTLLHHNVALSKNTANLQRRCGLRAVIARRKFQPIARPYLLDLPCDQRNLGWTVRLC
jgi:Pyridine nucleotide-disulphide oxidoreductase